jgi:hypothetical protein
MKSNAFSFAELELSILENTNPESELLLIKDEILRLVDKFSESGQSGGSAPYTAGSIIHEIKNKISSNIVLEIAKDPDSLTYEFTEEINSIVEVIKTKSINDFDHLIESINNLLLFHPIAPITGMDDEWGDVREFGDGNSWYQNKRCSALFKDGKDGKPYYIDAIIKRDQNNVCWSGFAWLSEEDYKTGDRSKMVGKKGYIKSFPFTPKTFYVDVRDVEVAKDDWESFIVDPKQLEEIWNYYDIK